MLKPPAFANSLALVTAIFYLVVHLFRFVAPILFRLLFNAQFMGADVASLMSPDLLAGSYLLSFVVAVLTAWLFGYGWAWLYNKFAA